ncbi:MULTISPECIES: aromatic-ring-hydroxylating dioxygenase subunit beta [unclassified Mycolicibacterium]|uniref:aromatic-ring-hydroxylating dioxygenase subunit beta n=1 Tax=unclassified Mycolicibacterium TaxID=2636767 RepID=UPI001F4C41C8|nr:aromatic-ring-hydroxylating dioxygenase subunit beta [Mycolicibacterium sp. YH-1]UNB52164.1 aromatic-ring-hydroxylating dioxygenase subunit beta [Mycolicibacterium sp. YH-1]
MELSSVKAKLNRTDAEDFLYEEAALLDDWRLREWLDLFTDDGKYQIPSPSNPKAEAADSLFLINDNRFMIEQRVNRLLQPNGHAEFPHSRTRRLITNVRIREAEGDLVSVESNFAVYRTRFAESILFVGRYEHSLLMQDGELKIRRRRVTLDLDALRPQRSVSIIV